MTRDAEDWRRIAQQALAISDRFFRTLPARPVAAQYDPHASIGPLPEQGDGAARTLEIFEKTMLPFLSGSAGSRYLAYVTGGVTPAALLGDWLVGTVDQDVGSPGDSIATRVTVETIRWLLELFDLPASDYDGVLTTGATTANLLALLAAREWASGQQGFSAAENGLARLPRFEILSASAHVTFIKMLAVAGHGRQAITSVAMQADSQAMDLRDLELKLKEGGAAPKMVVASAGTVTTTDFDDLSAIADLCRQHNAWLHVDAAFGIYARSTPRLRSLAAGLELADSITGDAHKWLNVPYESGFFFTRHIDCLEAACAASAVYLESGGAEPEFLSRGIESSQRFRALPIWMTLAAYGRSGVASIVEHCCRMAGLLAAWIIRSERFELLCPVRLNVVCFRLLPRDGDDNTAVNDGFLMRLNQTGLTRMTPGSVKGVRGVRAAFCNWRTDEGDIETITLALRNAA
jgi:glutamate/tyrosine decarboxylase-like PLP-dependent enzyme